MSIEQEHWATLIAHAWKNPKVLANLQEDPKKEIDRLLGDQNDSPKDGDPDFIDPNLINRLGSSFPLPDRPEGLGDLSKPQLKKFLEENSGIFGIMQTCCL